ncbi:hypothetical protein D3C71_1520530 [compost metagenome]
MAVFVQQFQHGGNRRQTGCKSISARAAFQFSNRRFQGVARWVAAARVFVARMFARCRLRKRRGRVNRRHHRPVLIVKLAAVDAKGCQVFHHYCSLLLKTVAPDGEDIAARNQAEEAIAVVNDGYQTTVKNRFQRAL